MAKILDAEDATATAAHQRNVGFIQDRFSAINKGGLPSQANPAAKPTTNTASHFSVGQQVTLKNGKTVTVTAVHPDGSFDAN
jgi:hypothetical protein